MVLDSGGAGFPYTGTLPSGADGKYRIINLTPNTAYTVSLTGVTDDFDLAAYSDGGFSVPECQSGTVGVTADESCVATTNAAGDLYVLVDGAYAGSGGNFTLDMVVVGTVLDGAGLGILHSGSLPGSTDGYYQVINLTPDTEYTVELTGLTGDLHLRVYSDGNFGILECESQNPGITSESCLATSTGAGQLFIKVDGINAPAGGSFTLNKVAVGTVLNAAGGDVPHNATLPASTDGLYQVINLTANTAYTVSLTGLSANFDLEPYSDGGLTVIECSSTNIGTVDESCVATSNSAGQLFIFVSGFFAPTGGDFTLDAVAVGTVLDPLGGDVPHNATLPAATNGIYQVINLPANAAYTVSLTGLTNDFDLRVYSDGGLIVLDCRSDNVGATTSESCSATSTSAGQLFIVVDGFFAAAGGNFTLDLKIGTVLDAAGGDVPHPGTLPATTNGFFRVINLPANTAYTVSLTGLTDDFDLQVYSGGGFSVFECESLIPGAATDESCVASSGAAGEILVVVDATFATAGGNFTLNMAEVGQALDASAGGLPLASSLPATINRHYVVTNLTANTVYTVSLTGLTDDFDLKVYSDSDFVVLECQSLNIGTTASESCLATSNSAGQLFILIDGTFAVLGGNFTLNATP